MSTLPKNTNTVAKPEKLKATGGFIIATEASKIIQVAKFWVDTPYAS